jgi:hypothetical protein
MRNFTLTALTVLLLFFVFSFKKPEQPGNAITEKRSGMDVYVYCSPTKSYDLVSNEKFVVAMDCNEIFTKPVKKAAGKGDAVIIYPELGKFDIIKYK